ncbi:protein of unknown function [Azospirillum baldaniorum]|uniref:Uncharacterized protein n=1 Tax=Azospirillum baldaniorum TaxID=1064539 RepID=A0A9P1JT53_9PROT|nr:protein of unknown function [Azospirillum baldaniorum]
MPPAPLTESPPALEISPPGIRRVRCKQSNGDFGDVQHRHHAARRQRAGVRPAGDGA